MIGSLIHAAMNSSRYELRVSGAPAKLLHMHNLYIQLRSLLLNSCVTEVSLPMGYKNGIIDRLEHDDKSITVIEIKSFDGKQNSPSSSLIRRASLQGARYGRCLEKILTQQRIDTFNRPALAKLRRMLPVKVKVAIVHQQVALARLWTGAHEHMPCLLFDCGLARDLVKDGASKKVE